MWGIIPAAGTGTRIQPLAFSKELLPVGSRFEDGVERPRAVSEYLVERLALAGATKICFVIAPGKSDILEYYGGSEIGATRVAFVVQPQPRGLCDAIFRTVPLIPKDEAVMIGLPDTIWFPDDALCALDGTELNLLLFPVQRPELFDAVVSDERDRVQRVEVKAKRPTSHWIWGAMKIPGAVFHQLFELWEERGRSDEFLGTLFNAWIERGGRIVGTRAGHTYVDVGTIHGYREAIHLLSTEGRIFGRQTSQNLVTA